jgi:hypothetical protein
MAAIDLRKVEPDWYSPGPHPSTVELPPLPYLMADGSGEPDPATNLGYRNAVEALYPVAYGVRKAIKERTGSVYVVMPLEGLWWADDMEAFTTGDRAAWRWTLMIRLPPVPDASKVEEVIADTARRKRLQTDVRYSMLEEGTVAQVMHVGPYSAEAPVVAALHDFIASRGYERRGFHHEIYLSDPRRVDAARLRTVLRQPIQPAPSASVAMS